MPETPNHGYNIPEKGVENWHEPLNENFEQHDTDVEIRDADGNRTDYEAKAGAKFLATDTGTVYVGTGSEWVPRLVLGQHEKDGADVVETVFRTDGVRIEGDIEASGTKSFVQPVATADGKREVVYTATEAPTPYTEISGLSRLSDGRARIELPDHFALVTASDEPLVVQTTPYSSRTNGLAVLERSTERVIVEDCAGDGSYEFAYTVRGSRKGSEDKEVVRDPER